MYKFGLFKIKFVQKVNFFSIYWVFKVKIGQSFGCKGKISKKSGFLVEICPNFGNKIKFITTFWCLRSISVSILVFNVKNCRYSGFYCSNCIKLWLLRTKCIEFLVVKDKTCQKEVNFCQYFSL